MSGLIGAVSAMVVAAVLIARPATADECLDDWGMAGEIVRRENLITVEEVSKSLAADGVGQLVKTTLCKSETGYFYRLVIRSPTGQLRTTIMTAKVR